MVAVVAATLLALSLNRLIVNSLEVEILGSQAALGQVQSLILRRISQVPAAATIADTKQLWRNAVAEDSDLAAFLEQTMAQSRSLVEIDVAGDEGLILASSNPRRRGSIFTAKQNLGALRNSGQITLMMAVLTSQSDYDTSIPLGIKGEAKPVFTIHALVSPVFLRAVTLPQIRTVTIASACALALAIVLAYWSAKIALRPLDRISHLIDAIASGAPPDPGPGRTYFPRGLAEEARELAAIESKLELLGERYRGARSDLETVLEKLDSGTRKHFESQIALAHRLTAINRLTGRVAHEIKNPLNSIALRLEMLRSRVVEDFPDVQPEFAILSEEIARLDRVVRTFLDFNRPVDVTFEDVDAVASTAETVALIEPEAAAKGIAVSLDHPQAPVLIRADAGLLQQAILNIAVNAIEAMESGGCLRILIERAGDNCIIRIADTGPGIAPDQMDKIFQLYFTTKPKGTGIGLAMAYRAMQLHGGTIEVESEMGKGAEFRLSVPLAGTGANE
jgi:signal transduction histidine kinase